MTNHSVEWISQPIADQIMLRCTCGWWLNVSVYEFGDKAKDIAANVKSAHVAGHNGEIA